MDLEVVGMHIYFCVLSFGDILWSSWQNETIWVESMHHLGFQLSAFTFCLFSHFYRCSAFKTVQRWLGTNPISANNICKSALCECGSSEKWGSTVVKNMYTGSADLCSLQAMWFQKKRNVWGPHFSHLSKISWGVTNSPNSFRFFSHLGSFFVASTMYRDEFWIFVLPYDLMFFGGGAGLVNVSLSFLSS